MGKERLQYLDIAKGMAIICVIIGHMRIKPINQFVYTFHMPLFIFISGYTLSLADTKVFLKKKSKALLIPYAFTCAATLLVEIVVNLISVIHAREGISVLNGVFCKIRDRVLASVFGMGGYNNRLFGWEYEFSNTGVIWFLLALFSGLCLANCFLKLKYGFMLVCVVAYLGYYIQKSVSLPWFLLSAMTFSLFIFIGYKEKEKKSFESPPSLINLLMCMGIWAFSYFTRDFSRFQGTSSQKECWMF